MLTMLSTHSRIAALAFLPVLAWGIYSMAQHRQAELVATTIDIGIEHTSPAAVTFTRTINTLPQLFDVSNDSDNTIHVSLPERWERGEVRGAPLSSIAVEEPIFGYARWTIPAQTEIAFTTGEPVSRMVFHNPSEVPLRIGIITVDIEKNKSTRDSYLVTDQELTVR